MFKAIVSDIFLRQAKYRNQIFLHTLNIKHLLTIAGHQIGKSSHERSLSVRIHDKRAFVSEPTDDYHYDLRNVTVSYVDRS